ncbi:MAG: MotA/TolQ/ExbB proton channel family protein [Gammaproteobacteria bacterium]
MPMLHEALERLFLLVDRGGEAMGFILVLSLCMWALILERYWFLWFSYRGELERVKAMWAARPERSSRAAKRLKAHLSEALAGSARRTLPIIGTLVQVLPLLGLLGTVTGMIQTFEVITVYGSSNRRGIAAGISEALLCTMAGLVTSLSGLYFVVHLEQGARAGADRALEAMKED